MSYGASPVRVFVSHSGPDTGWAEWVAWQLRAAGHTVELDAWDWQAGEDFVARMRAAMQVPGAVMVALLSRAYFEPGRFSMAEWDAARADGQVGGFRIVPVRVEAVTPPIFDGPLIYVDLFDVDPATARARLLAGVRGKRPPDQEPDFPGAVGGGPALLSAGPRLPGVLPRAWRVPPRNPAFTGRDRALADLRDSLSGGGRVVVQALHGTGGVGKSSLAVEYAHRFAGDFEAVWWIDAVNPALIAEQFRDLAVAARVAGANADVQSSAAAARAWLRREPGWLVVFDNAEDPGPVVPLLPEGKGQVVITSRDQRWGQHATGARAQPVDVFVRAESVSLLRTLVPLITNEDAEQVAETLGDLPLGVAQAAGFMAETGMSAREYLAEFERHAGDLLREGRACSYPRSLAAVVLTALERVQAEDPAAAQLLTLAAFLAPEPIPVSWFATAASARILDEPFAAAATSPMALRRTLARLARYGLVRLSMAGDPVLHRLTAAVVRGTLDADQAADAAAVPPTQAEEVLVAAYPGDVTHPRTWPAWADLIPHLLALDPWHSHNARLRWLLTEATWTQLASGNTRAGHDMAHRAYRTWTSTLGDRHEHTLTAAAYLAASYADARNHTAARALDEELLRVRCETLGVEHRQTLREASRLADDLYELGEVASARELNEDTLTLQREQMGADDTDTLHSAANLGDCLHALREMAAARALHEDTLARRRRVLGADHPDTLRSTSSLANCLHVLGEHATARALHEDTLARRRRVLGADHPDTLTSADELAVDLWDVERVREGSEPGPTGP